jgi:amino acid transporter
MSFVSFILGRPLASDEKEEIKIGVAAAVPAMGLDGLTSSAYGPEAALTVLAPLGAAGLFYIGPITLAILLLLGMLYFSYRQTISAYPVNGGSYTVAKENLGTNFGLLAAAALMIDYVLNVAVGISAGVAALVSAVPTLHPYILTLCIAILSLITVLNLRGTGEAGMAFAVPTYLFITCMIGMLGWGLAKSLASGGHVAAVVPPPELPAAMETAGLWIIMRAFASGCTAMTGVEAVSNGVNAFRQPTVSHAYRTLTIIVVLLAVFLGGIAHLARVYHVGAMPQDAAGYQSIISQLTQAVAGRGSFYYITMMAVVSTLCLSANTSFVDFPRLARIVAQDDFLPRAFTIVGRRLVYSIGILFLAAAAGLLLFVFGGITDRLIPLFAVGAFGAFTLSQAGMVIHWQRQMRCLKSKAGAEPNRKPLSSNEVRYAQVRMLINGAGAIATGIALVIILAAKFVEGAWITVAAIPSLLLVFQLVKRQYERVNAAVRAEAPLDLNHNERPVVLVPTRGWDKLVGKALRFSMWLSTDVFAVYVSNLSGEEGEGECKQVTQIWEHDVVLPAKRHGVPSPNFAIRQSPYRDFVRPILKEVERLKHQFPNRLIGVVIPDVVENHWWQVLLHGRKAARLRRALHKRGDRNVVVIDVPWYVND